MTTEVTCSASRYSVRDATCVAVAPHTLMFLSNVRYRFPGVRTQTLTSVLLMSMPAQRSCSSSIAANSLPRAWPRRMRSHVAGAGLGEDWAMSESDARARWQQSTIPVAGPPTPCSCTGAWAPRSQRSQPRPTCPLCPPARRSRHLLATRDPQPTAIFSTHDAPRSGAECSCQDARERRFVASCGIARVCPARWSGLDWLEGCLLYTSDAADDLLCVDLGGRRI